MNNLNQLENFYVGTATVLIKLNKQNSPELYVIECNYVFTQLSDLTANPDRNIAEFAFGEDTASDFFKNPPKESERKQVQTLILKIKPTGKWLLIKSRRVDKEYYEWISFDFTAFQKKQENFSLQTEGYRYFVDNFQGLAFQRIIFPEQISVFNAGAFSELTGYTSNKGESTESWAKLVHPDDREMVVREGCKLFNEPGYDKELEYRIIHRNGSIRWIHSYDRNFLSEDGSMQMVQGLLVDVTKRKEQELELQAALEKISEQNILLEELSLTDPLTGLSNRRSSQRAMEYFLNDYKRSGTFFSLILIDIDHFKKVNDQYGHDAGDQILRSLAEIMLTSLRKIDIKVRWGGEEFLIICPRTNFTEIKIVAEKLLKMVRDYNFTYDGGSIPITFSGGYTTSHESVSIEELIKEADDFLYRAKEEGRNRVLGIEQIH